MSEIQKYISHTQNEQNLTQKSTKSIHQMRENKKLSLSTCDPCRANSNSMLPPANAIHHILIHLHFGFYDDRKLQIQYDSSLRILLRSVCCATPIIGKTLSKNTWFHETSAHNHCVPWIFLRAKSEKSVTSVTLVHSPKLYK